jgi:3-methyladenine DNA glycosylase/8-oxoguanine DNA glycosylase
MSTRRFQAAAPLDPRRVVTTLGLGRSDPTIALDDAAWIAIRLEAGPATLRFTAEGPNIVAAAWGSGAAAALEIAPGMVGADDDPRAFGTDHELIGRLARRHRGIRITRSTQVTSSALRAVFGQKVTGKEAKRSYRRMILALGEPAPGPHPDLVAPPDPTAIAALGYEDLHGWGVERKRADTIIEVARRSKRLEEAAAMDLPDAYQRLLAVRGIGPWSAALVAMEALGDADAVPVGDFHIPNTVAWALAGEPRADDDRMLELLEPFRPHRGRVIRMLKAEGIKAPRFGPRVQLRNIERM